MAALPFAGVFFAGVVEVVFFFATVFFAGVPSFAGVLEPGEEVLFFTVVLVLFLTGVPGPSSFRPGEEELFFAVVLFFAGVPSSFAAALFVAVFLGVVLVFAAPSIEYISLF